MNILRAILFICFASAASLQGMYIPSTDAAIQTSQALSSLTKYKQKCQSVISTPLDPLQTVLERQVTANDIASLNAVQTPSHSNYVLIYPTILLRPYH